jgi:hypothetical protein
MYTLVYCCQLLWTAGRRGCRRADAPTCCRCTARLEEHGSGDEGWTCCGDVRVPPLQQTFVEEARPIVDLLERVLVWDYPRDSNVHMLQLLLERLELTHGARRGRPALVGDCCHNPQGFAHGHTTHATPHRPRAAVWTYSVSVLFPHEILLHRLSRTPRHDGLTAQPWSCSRSIVPSWKKGKRKTSLV